ncbi:TnsA-like heteromeric transposase endonuclease subunit [Humibacter antri]
MTEKQEVRLSVRRPGNAEEAVPIDDAHVPLFEKTIPWRPFRWYRNQRHYPGLYWSATMGTHVGYESLLELANLMFADFDPDVVSIRSQPFLIEGWDGDRMRRHVPDYLLVRADHSVCVVDVKPASKLPSLRVRDSLEWSRSVVEGRGWDYLIQTEPDTTELSNLKFLAGYRRRFQFDQVLIDRARARLGAPVTFGEAVTVVAEPPLGTLTARAVVLHLLWTGDLVTDMSTLLHAESVLVPR